jgi:hypothetical protein
MPVVKGGTLIRGNDAARFASKTAIDGECVVWTGSVAHNGYGKFVTGPAGRQRHHVAHRWAYAQAHGDAPPLLRHTCDNPRCVRVDHLVPGTQHDNVHDALSRGRRKQALTPEIVRSLRVARDLGRSIRQAAADLRVNYQTAYQAAIGKSWRHVR